MTAQDAGLAAARGAGAGQSNGSFFAHEDGEACARGRRGPAARGQPRDGRLVRPEPAGRRHRAEPRDLRPAHADPVDLRGHRRGRVRRHDLLDRDVPEVEGRGARHLRAQHQGRDHLDGHPGDHPGRHGGPGGEDAGEDRRHPRLRAHRQGHRLPVEVAVRVRRPGRLVLLHARAPEQRGPPARLRHQPRRASRTTCSRSTTRWWCRRAGRSAC